MPNYEPTQKQLDALANMEGYINIRNPRTLFADKAAFDEYWKLVSDRCDQKTKQRDKKGFNPAVAHKQRAASTDRYYQDPDNLRAYAERYIERYQPSRGKLKQQLSKKCSKTKVVEQVFASCAPLINDHSIALGHALRLQQQGKNKRDIQNKLRQRLFDKDCIESCLAKIRQEDGSVYNTDALDKKVKQLLSKGLSQQAIRAKLCEQAADRPLVDAALSQHIDNFSEDERIRKAISKIHNKKVDKQGIIQRLIRKGFAFADIKRVLDEDT